MASNFIKRVIGGYQLVALLGQGGMGVVYKAYQPSLKRYVALKVLPANLAMDPTFVERFQREAQLAATLSHPNIIPIFDFGNDQGLYYIVMRLVEGKSLQDWIKERGAIPYAQALIWLDQVASALDFAHRHGIIHRDIKPSNILIDSSGQAILTDFGLAKIVQDTRISQSGIMGTPGYMSPEQIEGRPLDWRTDIYALGLVAYEMLTGAAPFQGSSLAVLLHKQVYSDPPPVRHINPTANAAMDPVIRKALAKSPAQRYATASQFVQALRQPAQGERIQTLNWLPILVIAAVALLVTLCVAGLIAMRSTPSVAPTAIAVNPTTASTMAIALPTAVPATSTRAPDVVTSMPLPTVVPPTRVLPTSIPPTVAPTVSASFFDDAFGDPTSGWDSGSNDTSERGYDNGEYFIRIKKPHYYIPVCRRWYQDVTVEVDARQLDTSVERYGILFRGEDTNFYAFRLASDNTFTLEKHTSATDFVTLLGPTPSSAIKNGTWNHLKVTVKGTQITLSINGQTVGSKSDSTFKEGCVGVVACTCDGSNGISVRFDNFRVSSAP